MSLVDKSNSYFQHKIFFFFTRVLKDNYENYSTSMDNLNRLNIYYIRLHNTFVLRITDIL